jgi:hypothetical protein
MTNDKLDTTNRAGSYLSIGSTPKLLNDGGVSAGADRQSVICILSSVILRSSMPDGHDQIRAAPVNLVAETEC